MYSQAPFGLLPYLTVIVGESGSPGAAVHTTSFNAIANASALFDSTSLMPLSVATAFSADAVAVVVFDTTPSSTSPATAVVRSSFSGSVVASVFLDSSSQIAALVKTSFEGVAVAGSVVDSSAVSGLVVKTSFTEIAIPVATFDSTPSATGFANVVHRSGFTAAAFVSLFFDATSSFVGESAWDVPTTLFSDPDGILALALTFDQNGRPIVFYQTVNDVLKLYWFNALLGQNVIELISTGRTPVAAFDYIANVNYQESDAWIFYARGNSVYSRLQRESWAVEHLVKTYATPPYVRSAGYTQTGVFQVVIDSEGVCSVIESVLEAVDRVSLSVALSDLRMVETFTPVDPDPPIVVDPDPPIVVDPPIVTPPTTEQGYWIRKNYSGGWVYWSAVITQNGGRAFEFKIKKEYSSYGETIFLLQGGYIQKSPTNQYYQSTFSVSERDGLIRVSFLYSEKVCRRFWTGVAPKFKLRVEITKARMCKVIYWKELDNGTGYEPPIIETFPTPFIDEQTPPFETEYEEKLGIGCYPRGAFNGGTACNTIIVDVRVDEEDFSGNFHNVINAPLNQWNKQSQSNFYNVYYKPEYWVEVTEA